MRRGIPASPPLPGEGIRQPLSVVRRPPAFVRARARAPRRARHRAGAAPRGSAAPGPRGGCVLIATMPDVLTWSDNADELVRIHRAYSDLVTNAFGGLLDRLKLRQPADATALQRA